MERFASILAELRQHYATRSLPCTSMPASEVLDHLEQFLATGNARFLKLIPMTGQVPVGSLSSGLQTPASFDEFDRRLVHMLVALQCQDSLGEWLEQQLASESPNEDRVHLFALALREAGMTDQAITSFILTHVETFIGPAGPNSAGRFILALPPDTLLAQLRGMRLVRGSDNGVLGLLIRNASPTLAKAAIADALKKNVYPELCRLLCQTGGKPFEEEIAAAFALLVPSYRLWLAADFIAINADRFTPLLLTGARQVLADEEYGIENAVGALLLLQGEKALPDLVTYIRKPVREEFAIQHRIRTLHEVTTKLGRAAGPALIAAAESEDATLRLGAIQHMLVVRDPALRPALESALRRGLNSDARTAAKHAEPAAAFSMDIFGPELAQRLTDKSKLMRDAAADALARHDPGAFERAASLLTSEDRPARLSGVRILATLQNPQSIALLKAHFDKEQDEDVRQALIAALKTREVDVDAMIRGRAPADLAAIRESAQKIRKLGISWIKEEDLPPLTYRDGTRVELPEVRYLLYRQSHQDECVPDVQAHVLYTLIDRRTSGEFALKILTLFTQSGASKSDAWALITAAMFGDARVISAMTTLVRRWADEFGLKLGQWGIEALALNGSDAALAAVAAIAEKLRNSPRRKHKSIAEAAQRTLIAAAQRLGISMDELGDRIVPRLGFDSGPRRILDCGTRKLEASIGLDFKLAFKDVETGKRAVSIPKTAPAELQAEFKGLAAIARETGKAQSARLETLMVRSHRWQGGRWSELFLSHPLLFPFAVRLVWAAYGPRGEVLATFRAMPDRSLTTATDETCELPPDGIVGIVHPIELPDETLAAWRQHVTDFEIEQPVAQIDRPIARPAADVARQFSYGALDGMRVAALSIRGRGQKRGWNIAQRHNVMGMQKQFAGLEAFVQVDGLEYYFNPDPSLQVTVRTAAFYAATSADAGSAQGRPAVATIPLGEVPAMIYSEAISDLQVMSGAAG